jgi:predicted nucleic acid-binding protein
MAVLVDTSVWRRYFGGRIGAKNAYLLGDLLDQDDEVLCHPAVLGELVLGGLSSREEALLARLPSSPEIDSREVLSLVRARKLARRGIGWVDCQLLASALVAGAMVWSLDRKLADAAAAVGAAYDLTSTS